MQAPVAVADGAVPAYHEDMETSQSKWTFEV